MAVKVDKDVCIGCGACTGVFPTGSFSLEADGIAGCAVATRIDCLACEGTCPVGAISH